MIVNKRTKKFKDLKKLILAKYEPGIEMMTIELMHGLIFRIQNSRACEDNIFISYDLYNEHEGPWTDCYISNEPSYHHYWVKQIKRREIGDTVLEKV